MMFIRGEIVDVLYSIDHSLKIIAGVITPDTPEPVRDGKVLSNDNKKSVDRSEVRKRIDEVRKKRSVKG